MQTTPAASPSRPSTKFTAFTVATTMNTVSSAPCAGSTANWVPSLLKNQRYCMFWVTRKPAAAIWAPSLVSASSSKRSSRVPIAHRNAPAISTIPASRNTKGPLRVERNGSSRAMRYAATRPPSIASPPKYGTGSACTSRSRTLATAPVRSAISRATTVSK